MFIIIFENKATWMQIDLKITDCKNHRLRFRPWMTEIQIEEARKHFRDAKFDKTAKTKIFSFLNRYFILCALI